MSCHLMMPFAHNVRRLMARRGMTLRQLVTASGLHERTVKAALHGDGKPHARTLHRLARGLEVATDELFQNPAATAVEQFNQHTNPEVDEVIRTQPALFADWTVADFEELYSHFGTGGALSAEGATQVALAINQKRVVHQKVALLLESGEAAVLRGLVDLLYQKIEVRDI
jgi:transcriptional regulator with XRE-family HTH domain